MKKTIIEVGKRWITIAYNNRFLMFFSLLEMFGIYLLIHTVGLVTIAGILLMIIGNNGTMRHETNSKIKKVSKYIIDKLY